MPKKPKRGRSPSSRPGSVWKSARSKNLKAFFTTKNGKRIYAKDYGYQGWPIGVA